MIRSYRQAPPIQSGYPLAPTASWFSVIVPIARTNLITNPSFETNTTNWTAIGGSIARSTTYQYHGAYSLAITPTAATTDGARYDTVSLTSGTTYAYSAKVRGVAGLKYKIAVETTGGVELAAYTFTASGRWLWVYGYYKETSSTTRRITLRKASHASTAVFYLDGVQVEALVDGELVSTYIDGDQVGLVPNQFPAPYVWNGTAHGSTSSRSGQTRAGGTVMRLDRYGFILLAMIGLGLPTPNNVSVPYTQLDGAQYERTQKPPRQFTLAGEWSAPTFAQLQRQISSLGEVLDRDYVGQQQPLTLLYQGTDGCGAVGTDAARLICSYQGGLEGQSDNLHAEQASLVFRQWLPAILSDGEVGATLSAQSSLSNANNLIYIAPSGVPQVFGTGGSGGAVGRMTFDGNGYLYAGGSFTSFAGVANTRAIVRIDTTTGTVSAMGTGAAVGGQVKAFAVAANGDIWAVGNFTAMGGAANSGGIAKWTFATSAWSGPNYPGGGSHIVTCTIGPDGTLYTGDINGKVYKYDGTTWTSLGTGTGASPFIGDMKIGADGSLYVVGGFDSINAVASTARIARYTLTAAAPAWQTLPGTAPLTGSATSTYYALAFGSGTMLYLGAVDGNTPYFYSYNGFAWTSLGNLTTTAAGEVQAVTVGPGGQIYIGGRWQKSNGVPFLDGIGIWNGSVLSPINIDLPGTAQVAGIAYRSDGATAIGFSTTGTATVAANVTITNTGTAKAYPTITIKGPTSGTSRIYQIANLTTGRTIYLNYTINAGETAILRFTPDNLSFTSDFQGNISSAILSNSIEADFFLQPGANVMSFLSFDTTVTATIAWRPSYNSVADLQP